MEVSGKSFKIKHNLDKPSIKSNISLTSKIAKDEYNWSPKVDIDEGIRKPWIGIENITNALLEKTSHEFFLHQKHLYV